LHVALHASRPPGGAFSKIETPSVQNIHPTAVVSPGAKLGKNASVGPYTVIEHAVEIGDDCQIAGRVTIKEGVRLGSRNEVFEGAVLGGKPQHLKAPSRQGALVIGDGNTIREHATLHRALEEGHETRVGDNNLIMVGAHIAHDCVVGSNTIIANNVMLAGHVEVGDRAYLSGAVGVHQFCRIGKFAMVGGQAHIKKDVPPYVTVDGRVSKIVGLNLIGLKRNGFTAAEIVTLKRAYRMIYRSGASFDEVVKRLAAQFADGPAAEFARFLSGGRRGFLAERLARGPVSLKLAATQEEPEQIRKAA
jgi:UDP-N-acetylglucosamine acyltransferase